MFATALDGHLLDCCIRYVRVYMYVDWAHIGFNLVRLRCVYRIPILQDMSIQRVFSSTTACDALIASVCTWSYCLCCGVSSTNATRSLDRIG